MPKAAAKTTKRINDISKASTGKSSSQPLDISSRSVRGHDELSDKPEEVAGAPSLTPQAKRTVIQPITLTPEAGTEAESETPAESPATPEKVATPTPTDAKNEESETTPAPDDTKSSDANLSDDDTKKLDKEAEQAAAEEAKRQQELQKYIESHEFNVPINTVAHRRSIKRSFLLTLVVFLLSMLLINLMLDTGAIMLVYKLPHTNFFDMSYQ